MIREIVLADRDGMELGADAGRHLARFSFFVVVGPIEGQRERPDRIGMMPGGQSDHGAGIEPAAQIAADRHVRAQPQTDRLLERMAKLRDVLVGRALTDIRCRAIVEVPGT